jgi:hypothetical protein
MALLFVFSKLFFIQRKILQPEDFAEEAGGCLSFSGFTAVFFYRARHQLFLQKDIL